MEAVFFSSVVGMSGKLPAIDQQIVPAVLLRLDAEMIQGIKNDLVLSVDIKKIFLTIVKFRFPRSW